MARPSRPWIPLAATSAAAALREHLRGDALHNLGRLLEARTAYQEAVRFSGNDPVLSSKLGYTEVRLGRAREGINRLKEAAERAPDVAEIRERLMKAFVAVNILSDAADQAEKLASLEGTAKAYLRAASIRAHAQQRQQAREVLHRELQSFLTPRNCDRPSPNFPTKLKHMRRDGTLRSAMPERSSKIQKHCHSEARLYRARNLLFCCRQQADSSPINLASE